MRGGAFDRTFTKTRDLSLKDVWWRGGAADITMSETAELNGLEREPDALEAQRSAGAVD